MSTGIYYFSGTGNSLHAARELQKRLSASELIPIVRALRLGDIKTKADAVGFVFPNFCLTAPIPVHEFLQRTDLSSAQYLFAICTRGGSPSTAFEDIGRILEKKGKKLNAAVHINMPFNLPLGKENLPGTATPERIAQLDADMRGKLDTFAGCIAARKDHMEEDTGVTFPLYRLIRVFNALMPRAWNYRSHVHMYRKMLSFYADDKCTGCGLCEKTCPAGKIRMDGGKPVWDEDIPCLACYACINYCPSKAVQVSGRFPVKSYTHLNARYHHPGITARDIADQK